MRSTLIVLFFIFLMLPFNLNAQEIDMQNFRIPDSLKDLSIKELITKNENEFYGSRKGKIYTLSHYMKAKAINDTVEIAWAYYYMYFLQETLLGKELYADSLYRHTADWNHRDFPTISYEVKGMYHNASGNYQKSLNNYEKALKLARENEDFEQLGTLLSNVASLKSKWGDYREVLELRKKKLGYIISKPNYRTEEKMGYLIALLNLSIGYLNVRDLDSTLIKAEKGYYESIRLQEPSLAKQFVGVLGNAQYFKQNYQACIDSMRSARPFYLKSSNQTYSYLYEGLAQFKLGRYSEGLVNLEKVDSVYEATQREFPELKELYQTFIDYYKKTGDVEAQLKYIDKLLKADSVLIENYRYVGDNISKKIDAPLFLAEKGKLLKAETEKKTIWIYTASFLGILSITGLTLFILYLKKQRKYKRLLEELLAKSRGSKPKTVAQTANDLNPDLVAELLEKLRLCEMEQTFLRPGLTLTEIADKFGTNTTYLSKVINSTKQKSFVNYINDLRINYLIKKLQEDEKYRQYSVRALQEEVGYTNGPSFTKAFYERTGLYPSWFIKQLKKRQAS